MRLKIASTNSLLMNQLVVQMSHSGACRKMRELGHHDDDLHDGDHERQPKRVGRPGEQRQPEPEVGDPPEVPPHVAEQRRTFAQRPGHGKGELDGQRPGREHEQEVGEKARS